MNTEHGLKLQHMKQRVEAMDADMSGSTFTNVSLAGAHFKDVNLSGIVINDANLSGARISNANLKGAAIVESMTDEMTIDGIAISDLMKAYRAANPNGT
jgi:uncharacterized protein YjbI with pentapeptide repeats